MSDNNKRVTTLKGRATSEITFPESLKQCAALLHNAAALLYTPKWCGFAQFDGEGNLIAADGKSAARFTDKPEAFVSTVFEARVFNEQVEMRWLHESEGKGRAVLISDDGEDANLDDYFSETPQVSELPKLDQIIKTLPQTYLLWGEGVVVPEGDGLGGWSRLTTARIGRLHVPIKDVTSGRVHLIAMEYLAEVDNHGNVAVIEERLLRLEQA